MGKNVTKKGKAKKGKRKQSRYLRNGIMALLLLAGIGIMGGMAAFNASARPNRDMQWYLQEGAVQVAAPPMGEGYGAQEQGPTLGTLRVSEASQDAPTTAQQDAASRPAATVDAPASAFDTAVVTPETQERPAADAPRTEPAAPALDDEAPEASDAADEAPESAGGTVTLTITAAGDCTLGGTVGSKGARNFAKCVDKYGYDYFFSSVRRVFEEDDLTIVNMEGTLTASNKPAKHGSFVFKGDPAYVQILSGSSVELCNVANNHSMDYGKTGLMDTARILDENGIGCCGYSQVWYGEIKGVRVAALGFTKWDNTVEEVIEAVSQARANCDLLIVNMHWGFEGQHMRNHDQVEMGHAAIDAGADLVIGTHPHVYQGIEKYNGKYIVYSLGNFCFAGNANPSDKRCLIFQQRFSFTPGMGIAQAGIVDEGINLIPATISSVNNVNDFQPTIMDPIQGAQLLRGVVDCSTGFDVKAVRWMRGNYLVANGLMPSDEEDDYPIPAVVTAPEDGDGVTDADDDADDYADDYGADDYDADDYDVDYDAYDDSDADDSDGDNPFADDDLWQDASTL